MRSRAARLALALIITAGPTAAQQMDIAASVPVTSPTGVGMRNLVFGAVTPMVGQVVDVDVVAAVAPVDATIQSGEFRYDVSGARGLDFIVTMPAALTNGISPPLAVASNGTQYGGYCVTPGAGSCTLTNFNPAGAAIRVCQQTLGSGNCHPARTFPAATELGVYVGGRLSVPATARAGIYTGTITLTIVQVY